MFAEVFYEEYEDGCEIMDDEENFWDNAYIDEEQRENDNRNSNKRFNSKKEVLIKLTQPQNNILPWINHNLDQRIAWHKKKIEEAKAKVQYHEDKLKRLNYE